MNVTLYRNLQTPDGTFGTLMLPGLLLCTVEDDWKNNIPGESCIPPGYYTLRRSPYYHGGYETFEVTGVPGRSRILIHKANTEEDVKGCIGLGTRLGKLWVAKDEDTGATGVLKQGVVESAIAFQKFMTAMTGLDEAMLDVRWAVGLPK